MKYYLIYLQSGTVVDICSYDDEKCRDTAYSTWVHRDENVYCGIAYDELQCLNVVV